ncbi:MAG TPA: hypothetical protein ENO17_07300 [Candidatus Atribacteria bacterium]|nr:hypothetical protein [Candidatus Atribacteria bacterium]
MNIKLFLSQFYLPAFYRKRKTAELFRVTAKTFGVKPAAVLPAESESPDALLERYAEFSKNQVQVILKNKRLVEGVKAGLFAGAREMGVSLRNELNLKNDRDFHIATRLIYKALKIDLEFGQNGEIVIKKCFFSGFYSEEICSLISSLDSGLIAGLSGGLKMSFYQRITEGCSCCRAVISK